MLRLSYAPLAHYEARLEVKLRASVRFKKNGELSGSHRRLWVHPISRVGPRLTVIPKGLTRFYILRFLHCFKDDAKLAGVSSDI
jgi:hypothetical protein